MKLRPIPGLHSLLVALVLALALPALNPASAQPATPSFSQPQLDQMLAPIALYPDSLLSQVLMAATYPREVAEAARWSREHPGMSGVPATRAVAGYPWDPSVKSLVAFPQILSMMDAKPDWTQRLGDAFLAQPSQLMDEVQVLRQRASTAGNLRSNNYYNVRQNGPYYDIGWVDQAYAYVPYYDPTVVYGPWGYADYPPVFWSPWPGYRVLPGLGLAFLWGPRIFVGSNFFYGGFDWPHHHPRVWNIANHYHPRFAGAPLHAQMAWRHDPAHRQGGPVAHAQVHAAPTPRVASRVEHRAEVRAAARAERHARPAQQHVAHVTRAPHGGGGGGHPHGGGGGGGGGHPHGGGGGGHGKK